MPNKKKKGFGRHLNDAATSNPPQHNRQTKRKQWTDHQMQEAIDEVMESRLSANAAAKKKGVPPTLMDKLTGAWHKTRGKGIFISSSRRRADCSFN